MVLGIGRERKLRRSIKTKKAYAKYVKGYKQYDKQPMTFANWKTGGREVTYAGSRGTKSTAYLSRKERKSVGHKD